MNLPGAKLLAVVIAISAYLVGVAAAAPTRVRRIVNPTFELLTPQG